MKTILAALALCCATYTQAQTTATREANWKIVCSDHDELVDFLKDFEERPIVTGRMGRAGRMAMLINTDTGTWTLIGYTDRGACIIASGTDVQQLDRNRSNRR